MWYCYGAGAIQPAYLDTPIMKHPLAIVGLTLGAALIGGSWVYNKTFVQACTYAPLVMQLPCAVTHVSATQGRKLYNF